MTFEKGNIPWNKGIPRSEETKKKISEANKGHISWTKGKHLSEAHKRNISEAKKGQVPWMKGRHHSEETRRKLSELNKGKHHSEETKRKISEGNKGKSISKEIRRKISLAHSGENNPMYGKTGEQNPFYGKHHSKETRMKLSKMSEGRISWNRGLTKETDPRILFGENHPQWLGGISFEPYGLEFNDKLKEQIRERDNYQCQLCWVHQEELPHLLSVHHIDYNKQNNDPQNLISLCLLCHNKTNFNRDYWETHFKSRTPL